MTEKDLISGLKELKEIKPRKEWVSLTKHNLLKQESKFSFASIFPYYRYALAGASLIIFVGIFTLSNDALPGDILYSVRKTAEMISLRNSQASLVFDIADRRLNDLAVIAKKDNKKNLQPAINEYQASVSEVAKSLARQDVKKVLENVKKLEDKKISVESLGIVIGEDKEITNALSEIVNRELADLEIRTLTEDNQLILIKVKEDRDAGRFSEALEKILQIEK